MIWFLSVILSYFCLSKYVMSNKYMMSYKYVMCNKYVMSNKYVMCNEYMMSYKYVMSNKYMMYSIGCFHTILQTTIFNKNSIT